MNSSNLRILVRSISLIIPLSFASTFACAEDMVDYDDENNWLCHPSLSASKDVCRQPLDTLVVQANGSAYVAAANPIAEPLVDCFYVYPTASLDLTPNSTLNVDAQEEDTTALQFGRYSEVCRTFAPIYRQRTLTYLGLGAIGDNLVSEETINTANEVAYGDVLTAFENYLASANQGRGFLLVGHSQGARLLARLVAEKIEPNPALAAQMIAAHLIGPTIEVPQGLDVGGTFASTPACRTPSQTGCVVAYSSFRKDDPELAEPRFGVTANDGFEALCTHPAALSGGTAELDAYVPFDQPYGFKALLEIRGSGGPYKNWFKNQYAKGKAPYYKVPGQFSGECVTNELGAHYLEVSLDVDAADPRADDYQGELIVVKGWGLHLIDMVLAQGDLVRLAGDQTQAWLNQ